MVGFFLALEAGHRASRVVHAASAAGVGYRYDRQAAGAPCGERILDGIAALRTDANLRAELFFQAYHRSACESTPPTKKATIHVPAQTRKASRPPRSLSITMKEAMHGVKSVMVTSDTTT